MSRLTDGQRYRLNDLMLRWRAAHDADFERRYVGYTNRHDQTAYTVGKNYAHLTIGSSSAFLVDIATGIVYGNKGWLKIDKQKIVGNAYDPKFDAAALVRDRFRYGHFENAQDGSLRQPIVRR